MAKTYIGVDVDQSRLHVVCLEQGRRTVCPGIASREIDGIDRAAEGVSRLFRSGGSPRPESRPLCRLTNSTHGL